MTAPVRRFLPLYSLPLLVVVGFRVHAVAASPQQSAARPASPAPLAAPVNLARPVVTPPGMPPPSGSAAVSPIVVDALPQAPDAKTIALAMQHFEAHDLLGAEALLAGLQSPAAHLVRARIARTAGNFEAAGRSLELARSTPDLLPLVNLEAGRVAWGRRDNAAAVAALMPVFEMGGAVAAQAAVVLVSALAVADPALLMRMLPTLMRLFPQDDIDAVSLALEAKAVAHDTLGQPEAARATRLERFLQTPVSLLTPSTPPVGTVLTAAQWMSRIEVLLAAHRNGRAAEALRDFEVLFPDASLAGDVALMCQKHMAQGVAARKLHHYQQAERELGWVTSHCQDEDLVRRASYLAAKVISIQDGLRAMGPIEAFVQRYPNHSMTDDALFWAGDIYQRRGHPAEAAAFYERIEHLEHFDDQCSDARWRLAWMAYRRGDWRVARDKLTRILAPDACSVSVSNKARALYWLGRVTEAMPGAANPPAAAAYYRSLLEVEPLGFYAQQALPRLLSLLPAGEQAALRAALVPPQAAGSVALCADGLASQASFTRGLNYLALGLGPDAAAEFNTLAAPKATVVSQSSAASQGVEVIAPAQHTAASLSRCGPSQTALLLVLLLDRAGAYRDAHWRLRTEFAATLGHFPTAAEIGVWRAAYPLAFRGYIAAAEQESQIPPYFLQSLAREESAFNPFIVSWAEAYGLTQLLLSSGQAAGRLLRPPVRLKAAEELLEPSLNARLGGALLGAETRKFSGNLGLALAAYNAGDETASGWAKKYAGQEFAVFAEEIGIEETRGYVQRVLRTFGIYRWLYCHTLLELAVKPIL